ncbi:MAG: helix-turn-helix domain-containing protein [Clostridiales bacterium]
MKDHGYTLKLEPYKGILRMLGGQFGDSCQSILYSLERDRDKIEGTVVSVAGTTTNASIGDPLPAFLETHIREKGMASQYGFINKAFPSLVLRTSLEFLADEAGEVFGCICIHHNIVHIKMITSFLDELTRPNNLEDEDEESAAAGGEGRQYTASNIQGFLDNIISEFLEEHLEANNFAALDKNDKLDLIKELDRRGVFLVKGAVNLIAKRINVSKFSIYNYLDEIREQS